MSGLPDYAEYEGILATIQLALAMVGMGALLAPRDFVAVFGQPRGLAIGLTTQLVLVPLVASVLARVFPVGPGLVAGIILVAAIPGGTMSNLITWVGRGNIALSISLTAVTTMAALVTTPLLLDLLAGAHLPDGFEMPVGRVAREIAVALILPLLFGMTMGAWFPGRRDDLSRWAIRGSFLAILFLIVGAAGAGRIDPRSFGLWGSLSLILLAIAFGGVAWLAGSLGRLASHERIAILVEAVLRNGNLGILVKALLFPAVAGQADPIGDAMLFAVMFYGAIGFFASLPPAFWHRRRGEPWQPLGAAPPVAAPEPDARPTPPA